MKTVDPGLGPERGSGVRSADATTMDGTVQRPGLRDANAHPDRTGDDVIAPGYGSPNGCHGAALIYGAVGAGVGAGPGALLADILEPGEDRWERIWTAAP